MDGIFVIMFLVGYLALAVAVGEIIRLGRINRDLMERNVAQAITLARYGGAPGVLDPATGDFKPHPNFPFTDRTRSYPDEHSG